MSFLAVVGVIGAVAQGVGAFVNANAQAEAARYNEQVQQRNAQAALSQGQAQAEEQQRQGEEQLGRMRASYGASGIEFSGDALGVYQDSATQANYDLAKVRYNAQVRATGYQDQATLDGMQAQSASTAGIFDMFGAGVNAGTSILKAA
jgi:hypothetical protein